ncbi:MAG: hypothetical protein A3H28_02845 [Acidobacteria bacterium RIFCSPLOWO2_02_FULL_61_28]|nr:MAG: hypothetical protein A3H28_02845 [Acidobacteria bacterium RIFCSPLOWO2_02_FULL_61_28]
MERDIPALMEEIRGRIELLESNLPARVDAAAVSLVPFTALWYREALVWRFAELCRSAFESFSEDKLASAILLTRAAVESTAAMWYLNLKIDQAIEAQSLGDIHNELNRLLLGSRTDPAMPEAINVLKFIDKVEKEVEGFRHQYEMLSEYAHPNWAGTALLYSKPDRERRQTDFGSNLRSGENVKLIGVRNLRVALLSFEYKYNRMADSVPAFIELCERSLRQKANGAI